MRSDLPINASLPGAVQLDSDIAERPPSRVDFEEQCPGSFLLRDVLTRRECDQIIKLAETMGFTEDAPVSLARDIRQNENCVWIADDALNDGIFERCRELFPKEVQGGAVAGLNARWRLYKYNPRDIFRRHTDGSWPGSGLDWSGRRVIRD